MLKSIPFTIHRTASLSPTPAYPKWYLSSSFDQNRVCVSQLRGACYMSASFNTSAASYSVSFWVRTLNSSKWNNTA